MSVQNQPHNKKSNILFVGDLPKEITYEDLSTLFKDYHFQFASLNNSKLTNIWAQVVFENEEWANKARHELNGEILIPKLSKDLKGKPIRICIFESKNSIHKEKNINQSLLIKNIDNKMTQKEFYNIFLKFGDIESAKIEYDENGNSKGYGYIYYTNENDAEEAKKNLNGKKFYDKVINIVNLIPSKSIISSQGKNLTLFVVNFPLEFNDNDLKKLFEKYGNIKYASVVKDNNGKSKGIGFITFSSFEETSKCISNIKTNQISFVGLPPLCVKYATKKEEREKRAIFTLKNNNYGEYKIKFNLIYSINKIENEFDLEKEIRLFIKVIMLQEYVPKDVTVNMELFSGIVTINKFKDYELFIQKYNEFCMQRKPEFECIPISFEENKYQFREQNQYFNNYNRQLNQFNSNLNNQNQNHNNINYDKKNNNIFPNMLFINEQDDLNFNSQNKNLNNSYNIEKNIPFILNNNINNRRKINNNNNNNKLKKNKKYNNQNFYSQQIRTRPIIGNFPSMQPPNFFINQNERNNIQKNINEKYDEIDQRNLQNLNPLQLQSQFRDPPNIVFNREMIDSKENEEISNEIADSIYEIAYKIHPNEAAKITGMIKEMGYEKMNMLLSKKEDLLVLIEKGYEMIRNDENSTIK